MDLEIEQKYIEQAVKMHRHYPVVDAHLDLPGEILLRKKNGEKDIIKRYYASSFRKAGVDLILCSVFVENCDLHRGWENALDQIQALREEVEDQNQFMLIGSREDLKQSLEKKKIGLLLYMEGLDCIGEDLDKLQELNRLGVRGAALTWSRPNVLAAGCCKATENRQIPGPVTQRGIQALRKLEDLSWFLDVSHLNDEGFEQVCRLARRPFIATHSCSREIYFSYRNLTDAQMHKLARQGGIMGLNGCKYIAGSLKENPLEMLCRHVEYEVRKIGSEHVGYGFDFCDSYDRARAALKGESRVESEDCLPDYGLIPLVTAALLARGMREQEIARIMGENFRDYFLAVLP